MGRATNVFVTDNFEDKYNGSIVINGLRQNIEIPHIIKMLKSESLELEHPAKCVITKTQGSRGKKSYLQLKSVEDAQIFIDKFDGQKTELSDGKIEVEMIRSHDAFHPATVKLRERYHWLKVTNLPFNTTDEKLMNHIRKKSKNIPKSVQVRYHTDGHSAMAFMEMKSSKEAQIVIKKALMSTLDGQQI